MLLAFNERAALTVPALASTTGLPLDELHRVLLSLTTKAAPILLRSSAARCGAAVARSLPSLCDVVLRSDGDAKGAPSKAMAVDDNDDGETSGGGGGGGGIAVARIVPGETFAFNAKFASKLLRIKVNALQVCDKLVRPR